MASNPEFEAKIRRKPNGEFDNKDKVAPVHVHSQQPQNKKLSQQEWLEANGLDESDLTRISIQEFSPEKFPYTTGCSHCTSSSQNSTVTDLDGQDHDVCDACYSDILGRNKDRNIPNADNCDDLYYDPEFQAELLEEGILPPCGDPIDLERTKAEAWIPEDGETACRTMIEESERNPSVARGLYDNPNLSRDPDLMRRFAAAHPELYANTPITHESPAGLKTAVHEANWHTLRFTAIRNPKDPYHQAVFKGLGRTFLFKENGYTGDPNGRTVLDRATAAAWQATPSLMDDRDPYVRSMAIAKCASEGYDISHHITDWNPRVRATVAQCAYPLSKQDVQRLVEDPSRWVRIEAARRRDLTAEQAQRLSSDRDESVRLAVSRNPMRLAAYNEYNHPRDQKTE